MPLCLDDGWNQVQFNLAEFTERSFKTTYLETVRVQIHANCRIRRVYFCDKLYEEDVIPNEYKLFGVKPVREKPKSMLVKKKVPKTPTTADWIIVAYRIKRLVVKFFQQSTRFFSPPTIIYFRFFV